MGFPEVSEGTEIFCVFQKHNRKNSTIFVLTKVVFLVKIQHNKGVFIVLLLKQGRRTGGAVHEGHHTGDCR